jgi:hypothetical protein
VPDADGHFTVAEARAALPDVLAVADEIVPLRAQLAEATHAERSGERAMALADLKGLEARMSELTDRLQALGVQIKGFAPLLLDFPMHHDGREVLLCWLEGERSLDWYHDAALGFAGRRPLTDLDVDPDPDPDGL